MTAAGWGGEAQGVTGQVLCAACRGHAALLGTPAAELSGMLLLAVCSRPAWAGLSWGGPTPEEKVGGRTTPGLSRGSGQHRNFQGALLQLFVTLFVFFSPEK